MIQKKIEKYSRIYSMLSNADKRAELKRIKHWEEMVSTLSLILVLGTMFSKFGVDKWMISALGIGGSRLEYIVFPLLIIFEVALARTSTSIMPLVFLIATSLMATLVTYGVLFYFLLYSFLFIAAEMKLIAMKMTRGYPMFQDEPIKNTNTYQNTNTYKKTKPEPFQIVESDEDNNDPESYMSRIEKMTSEDMQSDEQISSDTYSTAGQMDQISLPEDFFAEEIDDTKKDR